MLRDCCFFSGTERGEEIADFFLDVIRVFHRPGNLLTQQLAKLLAQPVDRDINGADAHSAFGGQFRPGALCVDGGQDLR